MATHRLAATPGDRPLGHLRRRLPAADHRSIPAIPWCWNASPAAPEVMPPPGSGLHVPPALAAIHAANMPRVGGHILTGPVAVAGAEPGDMLRSPHRQDRARRGLGLLRLPPAGRHAAGGLSRTVSSATSRSTATRRHLPAALGHRTAAGAVLRRHGRGAAAGIRHDLHQAAARARRQPRQQGTRRGRHAVPAGLGRRAPTSRPATAMACRATARSASTRWRSA